MCKHQIVVILTCTDIFQEDILHYYETWYGSQDDHLESDDGIMEFDGLMNMEQNDLPMGAIVGSNDTINSSTPMERALA
jgi:hypothetical protein